MTEDYSICIGLRYCIRSVDQLLLVSYYVKVLFKLSELYFVPWLWAWAHAQFGKEITVGNSVG